MCVGVCRAREEPSSDLCTFWFFFFSPILCWWIVWNGLLKCVFSFLSGCRMLKRDNKHRRRKWRLLHVGIRENFFHLAGLFFIIGKSKFVFYFILFYFLLSLEIAANNPVCNDFTVQHARDPQEKSPFFIFFFCVSGFHLHEKFSLAKKKRTGELSHTHT